ncbi:hypothetical protein BSLG_008969 [Batrachochytrium salamandrivorans]|nr:hypothetical protein BSLG_008969 [Batrachochytrium salamandrivorans]
MSEEEWAAIPEVGDMVRRKGGGGDRRKAASSGLAERYSAVPDSVLLAAASRSQLANSIDATGGSAMNGGSGGSDLHGGGASAKLTDFSQFGQARDKVLGLKLDQVSDSVSGQTTIDPKGYLTDLGSVVIKSDSEISDIKELAHYFEHAGKISAARDAISRGCDECPMSEDSVKIWLRARDLESDTMAQKRVLRRALEYIPNSIKIWKAAVSLEEDPDDARILLSRAVECVPLSVELWLALARLESYDNARKVLNKARQAIPTSHEIWVGAAKLEEQNSNIAMVGKILERSVVKLTEVGTNLDRDQWLAEAEACEKDGFNGVAEAIVRCTISLGIEEDDYKQTWMDDADGCIARGSTMTARAIYTHALGIFPNRKSIWRQAAFFEKANGTAESLQELLQRAVRYCPQAEVLWLMGAKEKWLTGQVDAAKAILSSAFSANPNSEQIWLAAIKLEVETGEYGRARVLLASTDQDEDLGDAAAARETFIQALKRIPKSMPLWLLASRLEERVGSPIKARATLEKARIMNAKVPEFWCEAIRVEVRAGNDAMARALLAKALQDCSSSGLLWSEAILLENRPQRKARSADALKKCENDPLVVATIARLFWAERKIDKVRNWFNRAVKTNPDLGDSWAWWLCFEMAHGTQEQIDDVIRKCVAAEPRHGELWPVESKRMSNVGRKTEEILKLVAASMKNDL